MKKVLFASLMSLLMAVSTNVWSQESEEFKPSGKLFGVLFADYHNTFTGGGNVSVFQVTRSFMGFDYSFSKTISSRLLYDASSQSVSGKALMAGYLRNAYLQYDNGKLLIRGGLMESEHISHESKFWNYRYISKAAIDANGMVLAADLGVIAKIKPAEAVTVDLGILNGRGFKDLNADTTFKFVSGISVSPAKNILLRGYFDVMGPEGRRQQTYSLEGAYTGQKLTIGAEYFNQLNHLMEDGDNYSGFTVFASLKVNDKVSLFGRYDRTASVTPESETVPWNLSKDGSNLIFGFDYSPAKGIRIAPNFTGFIPASETEDFTGNIGLNIEAKF